MNTKYITAGSRAAGAISLALLLTLGGCDSKTNTSNPSNTNKPTNDGTQHAPDNTGRNTRDTNEHASTPINQSESSADVRITADIRKAIIAEDGMSTNAQNCKIVTNSGSVTLRGPVDSQAEKDRIAAIARGVAGVTSVNNELEVVVK